MGVWTSGHALVLIQPIDHQHQTLADVLAGGGGPGQQIQQERVASGFGQDWGQVLTGQVGELFQQHLGERLAGVLGGEPGGDEERDDPRPLAHLTRRAQHEGGHQRRFARPRLSAPPGIPRPVSLHAEPGQLRQLCLPADQPWRVGRRDPPDLLQVCQPGRHPPGPHVDRELVHEPDAHAAAVTVNGNRARRRAGDRSSRPGRAGEPGYG